MKLMFYFFIFLSFLLFCFSFLEFDPLKSCIIICLGIISMSCYVSLGIHVWYSYFIVLVFLSGIFSLLTYFCSLSILVYFYNYFYLFYFFLLVLFFFYFFVDYSFIPFFLDFNFLSIYYDFNYYYIYWIVFMLFLFLGMMSYNFGTGSFMRGF